MALQGVSFLGWPDPGTTRTNIVSCMARPKHGRRRRRSCGGNGRVRRRGGGQARSGLSYLGWSERSACRAWVDTLDTSRHDTARLVSWVNRTVPNRVHAGTSLGRPRPPIWSPLLSTLLIWKLEQRSFVGLRSYRNFFFYEGFWNVGMAYRLYMRNFLFIPISEVLSNS